jgi:hypothetical protein
MLLQDRMDNLALHAGAPAVDDPDLPKTPLNRLVEVFLDNTVDLAWLKGVQVDGVFDWNVMHKRWF